MRRITESRVCFFFSNLNKAGLQACLGTGTENRVSNGAAGAVYTFTKVSRQGLGEGWRDPSGLIWFNRATDTMNQYRASEHCSQMGGRLPTRAEFEQLGLYMGATRNARGEYVYGGFSPQVLRELSGHWFWSSSVYPGDADYAYEFNGDYGVIYYAYRNDVDSVRCVAR